MKLLAFTLLFISIGCLADCPKQEDLGVEIRVEVNGFNVGNHGYMDIVEISMPFSSSSLPFKSVQISKGEEIQEYWIPIATERKEGKIIASFRGYRKSIENFDLFIVYSDGECMLSEFSSVKSAYNKPLKQDK